MQPRAHHLLLVFPFLIAGCSTQLELSTEKRTPSETTESVDKYHTKVGVKILPDREEPFDRDPVQSDDKGRTIEIDGDGNVAIVVEGDLHADSRHEAAPESPSEPKFPWNTKIPWPTQLREASSWTLNCYLAVWGLFIGSIALMIGNLSRREGGPLLSIIAMLAAAAVLLQFLPPTESGIQFIPISPWSYLGWESFLLSLACWAAILGAGYVVLDRMNDSAQAFSVLALVAMSLNVLLSWAALK